MPEIFQKKANKQYSKDSVYFWLLRILTYFIIFIALTIFAVIIFRGAPVLWQRGWSFLTNSPETLAVIAVDKGEKIYASADVYHALLEQNKFLQEDNDILDLEKVSKIQTQEKFYQLTLAKKSLLGDNYLQMLIENNKHKTAANINYWQRNTNGEHLVGFNLTENTHFLLSKKGYKRAIKHFKKWPSQIAQVATKNITITSYHITVQPGSYQLPVDLVRQLEGTSLIYYLSESLREKEDEKDALITITIPQTATIAVSKMLLDQLLADKTVWQNKLTVKQDTKTSERMVVTMNKGHYVVTFALLQLLDATVEPKQSNHIQHGHNLKLGSIVLPFNKNKPTSFLLPKHIAEKVRQDNPQLITKPIQQQKETHQWYRFALRKDVEIRLPLTQRLSWEGDNKKLGGDLAILSEETHSYSAGGIFGPLVGTIFLVICCIIIALFIGISGAIFLNEYAKKNKLLQIIRISLLNLAGVPSVVFGLFGLGLFVSLAPKVTKTPSVESKWILPLAPWAKKPSLKTIEQQQIYTVASKSNYTISQIKRQTLSSEKTKFYSGWFYLSFEGWGVSILAGSFTLALMVLPVIIASTEESLKAVPMGLREASLALGASKWYAIKTAVIPYAFPGILTASVLAITRVAGETAPIMFTAAVAQKSNLPWQKIESSGVSWLFDFLLQSVQALPYHIYTISGRIPQSEYNRPMQYASSFSFLLIVLLLSSASIYLRIRARKKLNW